MKEKLLSTLDKSRDYTLQVADTMPSEKYDYKPSDTVMSFRELMHHISYSLDWMKDNYLLGKKTEWAPTSTKKRKDDEINYLKTEFDNFKETVNEMNDLDEDQMQAFFSILDHTTHHRGQAITYLRCNNIIPPEYMY